MMIGVAMRKGQTDRQQASGEKSKKPDSKVAGSSCTREYLLVLNKNILVLIIYIAYYVYQLVVNLYKGILRNNTTYFNNPEYECETTLLVI